MNFYVVINHDVSLSKREYDVLEMKLKGREKAHASKLLGISPHSFDVHSKNIRNKLGYTTSWGMVVECINKGLGPLFMKQHETLLRNFIPRIHLSDQEREIVEILVLGLPITKYVNATSINSSTFARVRNGLIQRLELSNEMELLAVLLHCNVVQIPVRITV